MDIDPPPARALLDAWAANDEEGLLAALRRGADANAELHGTPLLVAAAALGKEKLLTALLEAGANPNARKREGGETALMVATAFGLTEEHAGIRETLLAHGADINAKDNLENTALDLLMALSGGDPSHVLSVADSLQAKGAVGKKATLVRLDKMRARGKER